jgi:hypothetical protein
MADNAVVSGAGSGDVRLCLQEMNSASKWGVGILSMESNQYGNVPTGGVGAGSPWNFRYVKINGYMPTVSNAIKGLYEDWVEQAVIKRTALSSGTDPFNMYSEIANKIGQVGVMAILNKTYTVFSNTNMGGAGEPAGAQSTGLMGPPILNGNLSCPGTFAADSTTSDTEPLNIFSKSVNGAVDDRTKPAVAVCAPRS